MKMVYTIAAMLLAGSLAIAADTAGTNNDISEFHEHAMGGQLEITPHLMYDMATVDPGTGTDLKTNGFRLGSEVEYGVADRLSVGADLTYRSWETDSTPKVKSNGLEDLVLFTRGSSGMSAGRLTYGANLGLSLEDKSADNATSGGMSLRPYLGYEMMAGPGLLGAQVNYTYLGERTGTAGAITKDGGGVGLAAFYEYAMSDKATLGAALKYNMFGETKTASVADGNKHTDLGISIYAPIDAGTNMTVIPRLDWASGDYDGSAKASLVSVGAALRLMM